MKLKARSLGITVLVSMLVLGAVGCHRQVHVTNVPQGVAEQSVKNWYAAVGAFKMAAEQTKSLTDSAIKIHSDGNCGATPEPSTCVFPDEKTYQNTLAGLGQALQIEAQAAQYLDTVPQNWNQTISQQVQNYAAQISKMAGTAIDDGLARIKNPTVQATLKTSISLLQAAIQTAASLI